MSESIPLDPVSMGRPPESAEAVVGPVAGFWRRIGALLVDSILLGLVGSAIGVAFFDTLLAMGDLGRLIGVAIAVSYLTWFHSPAGGGQTLGKRALGVRVVGADGRPISTQAALARACVYAIPWTLNGITPGDGTSRVVWALLSLGVFGVGGSIVYLYVFNRRTRQSLHDLVAGSWVVPADSDAPPPHGLAPVHAVVVAGLLIASAVLPVVALDYAERALPAFGSMSNIRQRVTQETGAHNVEISKGTSFAGGNSRSFVSVTVQMPRRVEDFHSVAVEVAESVLAEPELAVEVDAIVVRVQYGYQIVIASANVHRTFDRTPDEWRQAIEATRGGVAF